MIPIEITAAGMEADTVIPTISPRYAFAAPKVIDFTTKSLILQKGKGMNIMEKKNEFKPKIKDFVVKSITLYHFGVIKGRRKICIYAIFVNISTVILSSA